MASLRTEVTEIVTGLAMLGIESVDEALKARPAEMVGVEPYHYERITAARADGEYGLEIENAWANGKAFAASPDGLRGLIPQRVEWKGPHKLPGHEQVPVDLRVDFVYLVSCKYGSRLLHNVSPAHLFDRLLAVRRGDRMDWYAEVAPREYQGFYRTCRDYLQEWNLPTSVTGLAPDHRRRLKQAFVRRWPESLVNAYRCFALAVSRASVERWRAALKSGSHEEEMLWRVLRFQPAPYFVLGTAHQGSLCYRVDTPWDFRQRYEFQSLRVTAEDAGQPVVSWRADLVEKASGSPVSVEGHVEIRWSHGRFQRAPEAKVYLKTSPLNTAGYTQLTSRDGKASTGKLTDPTIPGSDGIKCHTPSLPFKDGNRARHQED